MKALWILFCSCFLALQSCGGGAQSDQRSSRDMDQKEMRDQQKMRDQQRNGDRYVDEEEDDWDLPRCPEERNQSKLDTPVTEKVNVSATKKEEESISAAKRSMKAEISNSLSAQK